VSIWESFQSDGDEKGVHRLSNSVGSNWGIALTLPIPYNRKEKIKWTHAN